MKDLLKLKESALLRLVLCCMVEAPTAPTAPSMGVEEVTATPLEERMVYVIAVEEPPPASVGVNIYTSAPGRAQESDFSSRPRITSASRWRNVSRKWWFLIGLVFLAIVMARSG